MNLRLGGLAISMEIHRHACYTVYYTSKMDMCNLMHTYMYVQYAVQFYVFVCLDNVRLLAPVHHRQLEELSLASNENTDFLKENFAHICLLWSISALVHIYFYIFQVVLEVAYVGSRSSLAQCQMWPCGSQTEIQRHIHNNVLYTCIYTDVYMYVSPVPKSAVVVSTS